MCDKGNLKLRCAIHVYISSLKPLLIPFQRNKCKAVDKQIIASSQQSIISQVACLSDPVPTSLHLIHKPS